MLLTPSTQYLQDSGFHHGSSNMSLESAHLAGCSRSNLFNSTNNNNNNNNNNSNNSNDNSNNNNNNSGSSNSLSSSSSTKSTTTTTKSSSSTNSTTPTTSNNRNNNSYFIKYSPNNSFSSESPSESSSDEESISYLNDQDDEDDDEDDDDQHLSYSEGEGSYSDDDKDRYNDYFSKQYLKKSYHSEEDEDVADDDSSDYQGEEEYSSTSEEEELLSDDESSDKSSSEEESEEEDSDEESLPDESEEEIKRRNREWMLDNSNLSLKKSVSSLFVSSSFDSESEEEFDSSSGQEGSSSDKDIDSFFEDNFLPGSYSINITPPRKDLSIANQGSAAIASTSSEDDDEFYNYRHSKNYDYDSDDEFIDKEQIQREKEQDNNVLIAIRKSVNGINKQQIQIPSWYGYEDEKHISVIFEKYIQFLQIDQEAKYTLRGPKPFIGRIHRRAIQYEGEKCFTTLDTVKVYRYEIQPLGRPLNVYKSFVLLTCWDDENGLPTKLRKANSLSNKDFWANEAKSLKSQSNSSKTSSFLYCSPLFDTNYSFNYSVDCEKYPVDFLPYNSSSNNNNINNSPTLNHHHHLNNSNNNNSTSINYNNHIGNNNSRLSDSHPLLPNFTSRGCLVTKRRSSHPSLLLSSHIYSHSLIPQNGFKDKTSNDYS